MPAPLKILIVDDDPAARGALCEILKLEGYAVEQAADGRVGLLRMAEFEPDFVLCDVNMPVMDGVAFVEQARRLSLGRPFGVAIMSATVGAAAIATGLQAECLAKPIELGQLFQLLERCLGAPG